MLQGPKSRRRTTQNMSRPAVLARVESPEMDDRKRQAVSIAMSPAKNRLQSELVGIRYTRHVSCEGSQHIVGNRGAIICGQLESRK